MNARAASEVDLRKRKGALVAPLRESSPSSPRGEEDGKPLTEKELLARELGYETEDDFDEAVRNFDTCMEILREWDAKEKATRDGSPIALVED